MKTLHRIILTYGAISGAVIIAAMVVGNQLATRQIATGEPARYSVWAGYLFMLVALSVIFMGIKRYRDKELGGVIRFSTAFLLGLGITFVASVVYVAAWEVNLALTDYVFIEDYSAMILAKKKAQGIAGAELEAAVAEIEKVKTRYANPLYRLPVTFSEIFPVGLLISLLSAALLRNSKILPAAS